MSLAARSPESETVARPTAADVMTPNPMAVTPDTPLSEVAYRMIEYGCGGIPVVDSLEERHIVGIITDRDIIARVVSQERNPLAMTAEDAMSLRVETVHPDTPLEKVYALFRQRKFRRLPVVDEAGRLVGIVTLFDLVTRAPIPERPAVDAVVREVVGAGEPPGAVR